MNIIPVDDEKPALGLLTDSICEAVPEASVRSFTAPDSALAYAEQSGCDIAFLDIKMRGMSGIRSQISVIRKIRNSISINCGAVDCGYFDFLRHPVAAGRCR